MRLSQYAHTRALPPENHPPTNPPHSKEIGTLMLSGCLREWCPGDGAHSAKLPQPSSAPSPPSLGEEGPGQAGAQWHHACCLPDKMATFGVVSVMGGRYRPDQLTPRPVAEGLDGTRRTPHRSPYRLNPGNCA